MQKTKFSILIPAYKSKFLRETLDSCRQQTYDDYEIIIVDDASPENLQDIVEPYLADNRFHYYRNDINCGAEHVVDNWNKCLSYSNGDWVICMGDDDLLEESCLEYYAEQIAQNPEINVLHGRVTQIDEEGKCLKLLCERPQKESTYDAIIGRFKGREQYIGDFCFRKDSLMGIGGFVYLPFAWGSDDFTVYKCSYPNGIVNINSPMFKYRVSPYTISNSSNVDLRLDSLMIFNENLKEFIITMDDDEKSKKRILKLIPYSLSKGQEYLLLPVVRRNFSAFFNYLLHKSKYNISLITFIRIIFHLYVKK